LQVIQATLRFSVDDKTQTFPDVVFNAPPAAVTCWEQLSDGTYRLAPPIAVHWRPDGHGPNLTITATPARTVVVRVTVDDLDAR
jgi:hypothetical protein